MWGNILLILLFAMKFWIWHQKRRKQKQKIGKLDYIKLKTNKKNKNQTYFCTAKDTINRMKKQSIKSEKIFAIHISDNALILKICKKFLQFNSKTCIIWLKSGQRIWTDISSKNIRKWPTGTLKNMLIIFNYQGHAD